MAKTLPAPDYTAPQGHGWPCPQQKPWAKAGDTGKLPSPPKDGKK